MLNWRSHFCSILPLAPSSIRAINPFLPASLNTLNSIHGCFDFLCLCGFPRRFVFLSRLGQSLVVGLKGALPALSKPEMDLWGRVAKWPMKGAFMLVELLFASQFKNMVGPTSPLFKKCVVADFYGYAHVLFLVVLHCKNVGS